MKTFSEFQLLDELSKETLQSYALEATRKHAQHRKFEPMMRKAGHYSDAAEHERKAQLRAKGVKIAVKKLEGKE